MESFATPYPLFFSDGDQEVDKGQIGIHSVLQFKRFQAQLSRVIGIPANQLSAVFVCRRSASEPKKQKLPINENTNFNIILNQHNPSKEKDCYFLVSLKKSKKERKGSRRRNAEAESVEDDDSTSSRGDASPASQRPGGGGGGKDEPCFVFEASSPNSVLELEQKREEDDQASQRKSSTEVDVDDQVSNPVTPSVTPSPRQVSPPVTRIGGDLLPSSRGGVGGSAVDQPKFGAIGSGKAPELASPMSSHARFQDPVQKRPTMAIRSSPGMQEGRLNRALNTASPNMGFQLQMQEIAHHHHQQQLQQQQRVSIGFHQQQLQQQRFHHHHHQQQQQGRPSAASAGATAMIPGAPGGDGYGGRVGVGSDLLQFCPDCASYQERNIRPPPFHCCINDRITSGFNGPSPAGPIERPVKRQVKAAA